MIIFDMKIVGKRLYEARKNMGMTQEELAEAASMSLRTYADIERGCVNMRVETILRICSVLHITPNDIFVENSADVIASQSQLIEKLNELPLKNKKTALELLDIYLNSI